MNIKQEAADKKSAVHAGMPLNAKEQDCTNHPPHSDQPKPGSKAEGKPFGHKDSPFTKDR